jgi:predicted O-linked N-acetylglucosamine transferase (SPINDLY family)
MSSDTQLLDHAISLHQAGRLNEAEALYRRILEKNPNHPDALHLLGVAAHQQGKGALARELIERAITLRPGMAVFHSNLGEVLRGAGNLAAAAASYQQAIEHDPAFAGAWANLGLVLHQLDHQDDARLCLERALQLQENFADAWNNLGLVAQAQKRHDEAEACYRRAIEQNPAHGLALNNLANLSAEQKAFPQAIALYRQALAIEPGNAMAAMNLLHHRLNIADWDESMDALAQQVRAAVREGRGYGVSPFSFSTIFSTADEQRLCAEHWAASRLAPLAEAAGELRQAAPSRMPAGMLRVGYLSPDFRLHPVSLLAVGLFERHDRSRFQVHGYSIGPGDGSRLRQRIEVACDVFRDLSGLSALEAAQAIRGDGVDILIDLAGYTQGARPEILALRPAPIQVGYLGYLGTLGGGVLDYLISDNCLTPPGSEAHYAEKLVRLPWYQVNSRAMLAPPLSRREAGLPEGALVLCCFNQTMKIQPAVFALWLDLLLQAPQAVLWLLAENDWARDNLLRQAEKAGIGPDRLVFAPRVDPEDYYARLQLADLFLDTLPYNAGTTAADALWAGVPVLTVQGEPFPSRMASSVLTAFGMPQMITHSLDEYRQRALELLLAPEKLAALKAETARMRPKARLFDTAAFTRHFEAAMEKMAERQCQGFLPAPITVRE